MATTAAQLRDMSDQALIDQLADTKKELFNLRFQHVTGQLDNYSRLRELRRDVARIHTELRAREIEAAESMETT
jgi:large subunit ribosomal protein L29